MRTMDVLRLGLVKRVKNTNPRNGSTWLQYRYVMSMPHSPEPAGCNGLSSEAMTNPPHASEDKGWVSRRDGG